MTHENPANDGRIDYVEFAVTDLAAAKKFYGDVFGWAYHDWAETYASFEDGRLAGGFRVEETVLKGGPLVVLFAADLEKIRERLVAAGGVVTSETIHFPGGRRFRFTDPAGNELAVWSDRDENGAVIGH